MRDSRGGQFCPRDPSATADMSQVDGYSNYLLKLTSVAIPWVVHPICDTSSKLEFHLSELLEDLLCALRKVKFFGEGGYRPRTSAHCL